MLGIFDSGVGGLTIVREIEKNFSEAGFIYFGDTARVPWGSKSAKTVQGYAEQICHFFIAQGADEIIIACNTASAVAGDYLRRKFPKIKFYDVIVPAVEKVHSELAGQSKKALVIGTKATIGSGAYQKRLAKDLAISYQACPLFVPLAEEKVGNEKIIYAIIEEYLGIYQGKIDLLVLGCTHYPLLAEQLQNYFGKKVQLVSSSEEVVKSLVRSTLKKGKKEFYFSDWNNNYQALGEEILDAKIIIKKHNF